MPSWDAQARLFGQAPPTSIPNDARAIAIPDLPLPPGIEAIWARLDALEAAFLRAVNRKVKFHMQPFKAQVAGRLELQEQQRYYLMIQNTDASKKFQIGVGYSPNDATGLLLEAGGFYEPQATPQNAIYIRAVAGNADCTGVILYATELVD